MTALYRNYGYVVFRRCVVYLGEPSAAHAAVQEVFVRALRAAAGGLGLPTDPARLSALGERWAPWRSYAGMHLWRARTMNP